MNKLKKYKNKINEQRSKLKNAPNEQQTSEKVSKQIKSLENKLDTNFKEYNQAVAHNRQLRDKIDALRRERIIFDKNLHKLEQELVDKKKEMELTIKEAEQAYQAREQAKTDMETLKKEAEKEQFEFQIEWAKLEKLIEQDKQVTNHSNKK
jgi:chromosome segregation ATPase